MTIDLDFLAAGGSQEGGFYSLGPLGQIDLGRDPSKSFITYTSGPNSVAFVAAGTSYSGLDWWKGEAGSRPASVDGVHARYEHFFPSTAAEIVAGIDGVEFTLEIRSRPLVGVGELSYDFWLDASPGLIPGQAGRPLLASNGGVATVRGSVPIMDGAGRTVFVVTPATAFVDFNAARGPATGRSVSAYEAAFPAHEQGERQAVALDYRLERVGSRTRVSVVLPANLFLDPAIQWPVRVDPGITNPIANSSYFADETIIMDSDLVVTSTGAAQFSNVTLVMNRTASPNYNISVSQGGRITLLSSTVKSNDSALAYKFTVNGSFTAQDTLIQHANDGLQLLGDSSTLSNVTLQNGTGRALVIVGGNGSFARVNIPSPASTGLFAQRADLQTQFINVTAAGADGLYFNASSGNVTWSHVLNSTLNGAKVVNGSRINITHSEFAGSLRNGVLVVGGAPSIENSSITANNWSGVALFDDHSAYLYGNLIADNNWSGIETRLNSTSDLYANTIEGNGKAGVRVVASDPNIERNTIRQNDIGVWLEGAHNPGEKPGATAATEDDYSYLMTASAELADGIRMPLVAGVSIAHQGASTQSDVPPGTIQFALTVTNTDTAPPPVPISLSIDDDEPNWASLDTSSVMLAGGQSATVTLTVSVPSDAQTGTTYSVKVWANESVPPFPQASVWAYVDLQAATTLQVTNIATGNQTTVPLQAILMSSGPLQGKTVAFKLDGHWVGEATTDSGGMATVQYTVSQPPLSQTLQAYFNGTQYYASSSASGYVNISWKPSYLLTPEASGRWGDPSTLSARLLTTPDNFPAAGRLIHFTLDGTYLGSGYTDFQGYANFVFGDSVEPGTASWNASFNGDPYTGDSGNNSNFTSLKDLTNLSGASFTILQGETAQHSTRLTDDEANPLASRTVHFKRGTTNLADITTDSQGYANYSDTGAQSLSEDSYSMTYVFDGDSHFWSLTHYLTLTVRRWVTSFNVTDQTEHYSDSVNLIAQLRDEGGNNLSGKSVKVYLNGTLLGTVTTDSNGWATYADVANRLPKTYELKFVFDGDTRNAPVTAIVNLTVLREITKFTVIVDSRITLGAVLAITLRLTDDEGNALSRNVNVTLLGGLYANGTTDSSGYLTVNFDSRGILPERYVLWYFFDGDVNYSQSEAYTRIVVEFDSDLYLNTIEENGVGIQANNSSSRIVGGLITGNLDNIVVRNGSLIIYNGSVGLSASADYRLGEGGSLFSTNTTFNRGKVVFETGAVLLHVRWLFDFRLLDPLTRAGVSGTVVLVYNLTGDLVLNRTTNATGWFGQSALTEYTQSAGGRVQMTSHRLNFTTGERLFVLMDVSRNMTLFRGMDADLDGIANVLEVADDLYWSEVETHALEYTQVVEDRDASGSHAVTALPVDLRFTDAASFPAYAAGTYTVMVRASAAATNGTLRMVVKAENGTELANQTFTPSWNYRWFQAPPFTLESQQALRINLTDGSANPQAVSIRADELAVVQLLKADGTRAHYPGQVTDWLQADTDFDGGFDGAEMRNGSYWYEAEFLASADAIRESRWDAANSWVVEHANGTDLIAEFNETQVATPGVYAVRALGDGPVRVDLYVNGSYNRSENYTLDTAGVLHPTFRFEYAAGTTFRVAISDAADNGTDPAAWLDKVSIVLEVQRPTAAGLAAYANASSTPTLGTTPIYVGKEYDPFGMPLVYWVSGEFLFAAPIASVLANATMVPTWAYPVGADPTQPIVFTLKDGTPMLALTAGGKLQVFRVPIMPFTTPLTWTYPNSGHPNPVAYAEGWIVGSTKEGKVYGTMVTPNMLLPAWNQDASLGAGLGLPSIFHDKAYFGFEQGMLAINYNLTQPAAEAWRLGINAWWDPRDHCPTGAGYPSCPPPGTYPNGNRSVAGSFLFDMGQLFVVAYNKTETDLYRLTEDGDVVWAINLSFDIHQTLPGSLENLTAPRLELRNNTVIVLGTSFKAFHRDNGSILWGHDFGTALTNVDFTAGPVMTEREVVVPGPGGLFFFANPGPALFGDGFPKDGNNTFSSVYVEDLLWQKTDSAIDTQPLMGDFDGSGYRDLLYTNVSGFAFLKDFEVGHRNYLEFPQLGRDATHSGNAEYLTAFVATDPLDPDMDFDNMTDGAEVAGWSGFRVIHAEDASSFQAWGDSPANGQAKNYNMFHQTGVTLEADDGNVTYGGSSISWIRFTLLTPVTGTYRISLVPNTAVGEVADLRYQEGDAVTPENPDPSQGYGVGASLAGRELDPEPIDALLSPGQTDRLRQMVENATYLKVRYQSIYIGGPPPGMTSFGVKHDAELVVQRVTYNPWDTSRLRATVFLSMDINFELFGSLDPAQARQYEFEIGLNLSLIPAGGMGGDPLPATLEYLRILDIDYVKVDKLGLDPYSRDMDGDSILDGDEASGTPWSVDTDYDGLTDPEEIYTYQTNPTDRDTDHDGVRDRVELGLGGSSTGWASIPEWIAAKFRGDPHFKVPTTGRVLPNYDANTSTVTDPHDADTDNDGLPDGWIDGWTFDPSWLVGQIRHETATTEYLSRAMPIDYNLSYWRASGVFDSYPQIWEGEDADLDGAVDGGTWSFWVSLTGESGTVADSTGLSFIRKGPGETDPSDEDSDNDGVPEGYEVWYATRDPVWNDSADAGQLPDEDLYFFTPLANDSGEDVDRSNAHFPVDAGVYTPDSRYTRPVLKDSPNLGAGIEIPAPANPNTAIQALVIHLNLSAAVNGTRVELELWTRPSGAGNPASVIAHAAGIVLDVMGWVSFDIDPTWMNFGSDRYFALLKNATSNVTWWGTTCPDVQKLYTLEQDGTWDVADIKDGSTNFNLSVRLIDYFSIAGDGLTNLQEYLLGTNPKLRDTDAGTGGVLSNLGDMLSDGQEMVDKTIFRTNAALGGLVSTSYSSNTWLLYDKDVTSGAASDWLYFEYLETADKPNETFGGSKNATAYLFTLDDGAELRYNQTNLRLYVYLPGSEFENLVEETNLTTVTQHYEGRAIVFFQANNSIPPSSYKSNAVLPVPSDPWLFRFKQFYASDPFDWDTDDDGLADGWELGPSGPGARYEDSDGDFTPNVRDWDSDNDGLTDGQEMLQIQADWTGEWGTSAANSKFDPDNGSVYPMVDTDSDGDGIPDAKEVLWSVDTDGDGRINLVDADSDADGLCDGWCTTSSTGAWRVSAPPGLPNGEDQNQNGTNEQGESSPIKVDTDGDGLWDGYAFLDGGWKTTQGINGSACPAVNNTTAWCGEDSIYWLRNGTAPTSYTAGTNRTNPDSDHDGLTDRREVIPRNFTVTKVDGTWVNDSTASDPWKSDTDNDQVPDAKEWTLGTNATNVDTDADVVHDGKEDNNHDGFRGSAESSATMEDTDGDGLKDGQEDVDYDGVWDSNEPSALDRDTDDDNINDKAELDLMKDNDSLWTVTHDFDGDGLIDLKDKDSDNDGLDDNEENWDIDGTIGSKETNPYDTDTDNDLLLDRAEPNRFIDTADLSDTNINGRDTDSNDDTVTDNLQVWVQFRTNAVSGGYADSAAWIALDASMDVGQATPSVDFSASNALYKFDSTVTSPAGTPMQVRYYKGLYAGQPDYDYQALLTPEGYAVYRETGAPNSVYVQISGALTVKFVKDSTAPSGYSNWTTPVDSFTVARQETYEGRKALDDDMDHDKLGNGIEGTTGCPTSATDDDSDDDGILDGTERDWCGDTDHDLKINAKDLDSDNDGIADGTEDADKDGFVDTGELDGLNRDTDGDLIQDGTERGITISTDTADTCEDTTGDCVNAWIFQADQDSSTQTDPFDRDTDNDAIEDGKEDANRNGKRDQTSGVYTELNPLSVDSDSDGLQDGQEWGLTTAGKDTDLAVFLPDLDPMTHTNPLLADTDLDGILDGTEDLNRNGRVDSGEANPQWWDTDRDGLPDGWVNFGTACTQPCVGVPLGGSWGEDKDLDGIRDQNTDGDWTETDFLAADSDVDGIKDGWEQWGRWCYKTETGAQCDALTNRSARQLWVASPEKNGALIADFDADGLRDGQETAGWTVGIWRERTMEKVRDYKVASSPLLTDTESDTLTDFSEFMNGSDPGVLDTDGDGITDPQEIARKSNITGIEGTPPQISNVKLQVGIDWDWWGFLYLPLKSHVTVSFDVSDNVGLDTVTVKFIRYTGTETRQLQFSNTPASYTVSTHVEMRFDFSIFEALAAGADVNITAYDVNGNGAWGDFHIKSVLEAIVDAIAAFLSAIVNVIAAALSALLEFIWDMIEGMMNAVLKPISESFASFKTDLGVRLKATVLQTRGSYGVVDDFIRWLLTSPILLILSIPFIVIAAIQVIAMVFFPAAYLLIQKLAPFLSAVSVAAIFGVILTTATLIESAFDYGEGPTGTGILRSVVGQALGDAALKYGSWALEIILVVGLAYYEVSKATKMMPAIVKAVKDAMISLLGLSLILANDFSDDHFMDWMTDVFGLFLAFVGFSNYLLEPDRKVTGNALLVVELSNLLTIASYFIGVITMMVTDYGPPCEALESGCA